MEEYVYVGTYFQGDKGPSWWGDMAAGRHGSLSRKQRDEAGSGVRTPKACPVVYFFHQGGTSLEPQQVAAPPGDSL